MPSVERFQAVAVPGLEEVTARELAALGATDVAASRASVAFAAPLPLACRLNASVRSAERLRLRLARFGAPDAARLARGVGGVAWSRYLRPGAMVDVRATIHATAWAHAGPVRRIATEQILSGVTGVRVAPSGALAGDAVAGEATAGETTASQATSVQHVLVRIAKNTCTVALDMSGAGLDRRGYRLESGAAPIREHVAAALLLHAGWTPPAPLVDPMCGAGTLVIEAALMAAGRPPTARTAWPWQAWPVARDIGIVEHDTVADGAPSPAVLVAADRNAGALGVASRNAARAGVDGAIRFVRCPFEHLAAALGESCSPPGWLVINPPYGRRMARATGTEPDDAVAGDLAAALATAWRGWRAAIIAPGTGGRLPDLPLASVTPFRHGGRACRLLCTETL